MKNVISCVEAEELLGAYALDALPAADRARVDEHLQVCAEHRAAAQELKHVAPLLALTVEERAASPELRQRILDAVSQEPQTAAPQSAVVPVRPLEASGRIVAPSATMRRRWRWGSRIAGLAAAAVLLVGAGIGIGRLTVEPGATPQLVTWSFHGNSLAPNARAHLVYFKDQQRAVLDVTGLPALPQGTLYELWLFKAGKPIDAGVASTNGGLVVRLDQDLGQYSQIAITIEPGEQPQPTSSPILVGSLRSA
jgi:anti-sigma-K factor RskA